MTEYLTTPQGRRIAYLQQVGQGPGVVFLGGFRSDMAGTKAEYLARWADENFRAFLRLDYSGHGQSEGDFLQLGIGDWYADALAAIAALTKGPQVLVGSSMGGWIALLIARTRPDLVKGLVGIAAAPDFTEDEFRAGMTPQQQAALAAEGFFIQPSLYDPAGYPISRTLIEQGANNLVLRDPLLIPAPVRLLQGTADAEVSVDLAWRLLDHLVSPDAQLTLVKGADHRFSTPECLALIGRAVAAFQA